MCIGEMRSTARDRKTYITLYLNIAQDRTILESCILDRKAIPMLNSMLWNQNITKENRRRI